MDKRYYINLLRNIIANGKYHKLTDCEIIMLDKLETAIERFDEDDFIPKGIIIPDMLDILNDRCLNNYEKVIEVTNYIESLDEEEDYR